MAGVGSFEAHYVNVGPTIGAGIQGATCCIASDSAGHLYVIGTVVKRFAPALADPSEVDTDVLVTKFNRDLEVIYQSTLGGSRGDSVGGAAVDADGNLFIAGQTSSDDFPAT